MDRSGMRSKIVTSSVRLRRFRVSPMQGVLRFLVPAASALAVGLVVWSQVSLYRANHLVDEANTSIDAFNATFVEAGENFKALFSEANEKAFPANRAMLAP